MDQIEFEIFLHIQTLAVSMSKDHILVVSMTSDHFLKSVNQWMFFKVAFKYLIIISSPSPPFVPENMYLY